MHQLNLWIKSCLILRLNCVLFLLKKVVRCILSLSCLWLIKVVLLLVIILQSLHVLVSMVTWILMLLLMVVIILMHCLVLWLFYVDLRWARTLVLLLVMTPRGMNFRFHVIWWVGRLLWHNTAMLGLVLKILLVGVVLILVSLRLKRILVRCLVCLLIIVLNFAK